ncbi:hypothetical protein JK636_10695 [Clostridium sp. YIM B02515]|uniref:Extracellular solute-binding protein n=1 Tax=Clostridium rhizosphaerae TaxID=2803861 RepID=A0ABS1TA60_9CLOT|nr:hypothetical protein [Clostridium rhizosphaerae]MBL4936227.1 hypothetical protein [Clostridium rhizosphaerae]
MVDLKKMSRKEKIEYIWDYYKIHIIATMIAILAVSSFIYSYVTKVEYVFNLTILCNDMDENARVNLEKQITNYVVGKGEKRKQAAVEVMPITDTGNSSPMTAQYMQKFMVKLAAGEIDLVIFDRSMLETYTKQEALVKLDDIVNDKSVQGVSDNTKGVYAVEADNIKILKDVGFNTKDKLVGIISSGKQKEKAVSVLKWMINK